LGAGRFLNPFLKIGLRGKTLGLRKDFNPLKNFPNQKNLRGTLPFKFWREPGIGPPD